MARVHFTCPNCGGHTLLENITKCEVFRSVKVVTSGKLKGQAWPHAKRDKAQLEKMQVSIYAGATTLEPYPGTGINYTCKKKSCGFILPAHTPAELLLWLHDNNMISPRGAAFPGVWANRGYTYDEPAFISEMLQQNQLSHKFLNNRKPYVPAPQSGAYKPPIYAPQPQAMQKP